MAKKKGRHRTPGKPGSKKHSVDMLAVFCMATVLLSCISFPAHAKLSAMENSEMEAITGTGGFSMSLKNIQIFQHIDTLTYCASDNGYIVFQNIKTINADDGGVALFNYDFGTVTNSGVIYYDIFQPSVASVDDWDPLTNPVAGNRIMTKTVVPNWDQKLAYRIGDLIFCDPTSTVIATPVDLGEMLIGNIHLPRFSTYTSARIDGSGFDFQTNFQMTIDKIGYAYNDSCDALEFCPTYIGGNFVDGTDDPRNPASWMPNRAVPQDFGEFQIGDLFGDMSDANPANWDHSNPAMFDVAYGEIYPDQPGSDYGFAALRLSMEGSIRFENATFDGTDFGPGAIDGIEVHRLDLKLIP